MERQWLRMPRWIRRSPNLIPCARGPLVSPKPDDTTCPCCKGAMHKWYVEKIKHSFVCRMIGHRWVWTHYDPGQSWYYWMPPCWTCTRCRDTDTKRPGGDGCVKNVYQDAPCPLCAEITASVRSHAQRYEDGTWRYEG